MHYTKRCLQVRQSDSHTRYGSDLRYMNYELGLSLGYQSDCYSRGLPIFNILWSIAPVKYGLSMKTAATCELTFDGHIKHQHHSKHHVGI